MFQTFVILFNNSCVAHLYHISLSNKKAFSFRRRPSVSYGCHTQNIKRLLLLRWSSLCSLYSSLLISLQLRK